MDIGSLKFFKSQSDFISSLVKDVLNKESFIILSGDSKSGRSVICEQVVNASDGKAQTVFIPCHKDMSISRLRELLLQQLIPNTKFDIKINLADILAKAHIPYKQKILIVVDDADSVVSSFFEELKALYEQNLGQNRYSFLIVGHELWAQTRLSTISGKGAQIVEKQVPTLSLQEALDFSLYYFKLKGAFELYRLVQKKLPQYLKNCNGNIGQIIEKVERLMKDPNIVQKDVGSANTLNKEDKSKKKSSSVGIFITIICIAIVIACLIPLFIGGGFSSIFGKDDEVKELQEVSTPVQMATEDPFVNDNARLADPIPEGLETTAPQIETQRQVILDGEALDEIESQHPRQGVGSNVTTSKDPATSNATASKGSNAIPASQKTANSAIIHTLKREDSLVREADIKRAKEQKNQILTTDTLSAKSNEQAKIQKAASLDIQTEASNTQKSTNNLAIKEDKTKSLVTKSTKANNNETTTKTISTRTTPVKGIVVPEKLPFTGMAIPGSSDEILRKNGGHYTLQVVAGSNRQKVVDSSAALVDRYWIYETVRNGRPWYVLITGDYLSRNEALAAAKRLPAAVRAARPFAKSFATVQQEMLSQR